MDVIHPLCTRYEVLRAVRPGDGEEGSGNHFMVPYAEQPQS
jgi:hypothetical protein